jgi:hypothetical protein
VWCVRRRTARRSRGGCFFVRDREISPEPAAAAISHAGLCATSFACGFFASLWRVEENRGLLTLGESKNENPSFARFSVDTRDRDARDFAKPSRKRSLASRCSCDDRSPPARATHSEARRVGQSGRALSRWHGRALGHTSRALGSTRRCTRRSRHREEGRTRATLDSVDRHP